MTVFFMVRLPGIDIDFDCRVQKNFFWEFFSNLFFSKTGHAFKIWKVEHIYDSPALFELVYYNRAQHSFMVVLQIGRKKEYLYHGMPDL